ncbi:MAG: putative tellurite resistance protein B-like protein [Polaribacter sp.]|jgi:uncharacterized tellurite resistance protein B-like protein
MFNSLQDFFSRKSSGTKSNKEPTDDDLKLAAATLMFEMVRSDGKVDQLEIVAMAAILRKQFNLPAEDIHEMIRLARHTSDHSVSLQGFTSDICGNWGNAKRVKLLEYLWLIALADQRVDAHERHLLRKVAGLLYMTEVQIVQAKENATATLGLDDF